jgi:phospholipid/cholesterol/gamma-HCH transport system permease protein
VSAWQIARRDDRLDIAGELRIVDAARIWQALRAESAHPGPALDLDLSGATAVDGAVASLLVEHRARLVGRGVRSEIVGAPERIAAIIHLYHGDEPPLPAAAVPREGAIARLGAVVEQRLKSAVRAVAFTGEFVGALGSMLRSPASVPLRDLPALVARAGTDGIPIVMLLNFLIGFVMAFQSTAWLKLYGANIYVADIVGVSVTRELAPLITAVIIIGRSGAAYAAELGTMRVSEEIDALCTMGFAPVPYLVLPRVVALALVAPMLTLIADVVGVAGGLAVAIADLDVTPTAYVVELRTLVGGWEVVTGLIKSGAFGIAIALIGCQQGLATRRSASAVGYSTTRTVVSCLFTTVIIDALLTVLFVELGV